MRMIGCDLHARQQALAMLDMDAELILGWLAENRFPAIRLPIKELLDLRALLLHRHQWVRIRTRVQNALQSPPALTSCSSGDRAVAIVDGSGMVTSVNSGRTRISATHSLGAQQASSVIPVNVAVTPSCRR